jgi:hypothetical protein
VEEPLNNLNDLVSTETAGDLIVNFDLSDVLEQVWCAEGVVTFLDAQMLNLMPEAKGFAVSPPMAGVQGWVKFEVEPTPENRRKHEGRLRAVLGELVRTMQDSDGEAPCAGGYLRWSCPACEGKALKCGRCEGSGYVEQDPSGRCRFRLERAWVYDYERKFIYRFDGESLAPEEIAAPHPTNREGLTWPEWEAAATFGWKSHKNYESGNHFRDPIYYRRVLRKAWEAGEDPTEYAAKGPPSRKDIEKLHEERAKRRRVGRQTDRDRLDTLAKSMRRLRGEEKDTT